MIPYAPDIEEIKKVILKPENEESLKTAKLMEKQLSHFFTGQHVDDVIFIPVGKILTDKKYTVFKNTYKTWTKPIVNRVKTHYGKVFTASGGRVTNVFEGSESEEKQLAFNEMLTTVYTGVPDFKYWESIGINLSFYTPNSTFITAQKDGEIVIKHAPLDSVRSVKCDESGIRHIVYCYEQKVNGDTQKVYYSYDDLNFYALTHGQDGKLQVMTSTDGSLMAGPHGAKKNPVTFVSSELVEGAADHGFVLRKSRITDSIGDLFSYAVLKTFYLSYKYYGAFGKEIKAQTRCNYKSEELNIRCDGRGNVMALNPELSSVIGDGTCPQCATKNTGILGEIVSIPIEMQGEKNFVANISQMFQRIDADTGILEFHSSDIEALEAKIKTDCIGRGFGSAINNQAVNRDQVRVSYDDIESNLNEFSRYLTQTWNYSVNRAGEMYSSEFRKYHRVLGKKYFLKSSRELIEELGKLAQVTNDQALIDIKTHELIETETRNNPKAEKRAQRIRQVKPFNDFSLNYMAANQDGMRLINADAVDLFFNFNQVLSIFESEHGRLEEFAARSIQEEVRPETQVIQEIQAELYSILDTYGIRTNAANGGNGGA